jgi:hypothetical protein
VRTDTPPVLQRIIRDISFAVPAGLLMGATLSAIAVAIVLFGGNSSFEHFDLSLIRAIIAYLVAGATAGLLVGLLLPLTRWVLGAALLAFTAAFIVWFVIGWSISPADPLLDTMKTSVELGAAFGLPMGVGFWYQARRYRRTGKWS